MTSELGQTPKASLLEGFSLYWNSRQGWPCRQDEGASKPQFKQGLFVIGWTPFAGRALSWMSFLHEPKNSDGVEHTGEYYEGFARILAKQEPRSRHEHPLLSFLP